MRTETHGGPRRSQVGEAADTYQLSAPAVRSSARVVREFVAAALAASGHRGVIDDARICVSDAVANVVQHANVPVLAVEVIAYWDRVVIAVRDDDLAGQPAPRAARLDDEGGRGLMLIGRLAHRWGVMWLWDETPHPDPEPVGKRVWFELRNAAQGPPGMALAS
ncbi:ATP-binding protein [Streptomyces sp. ISL-11]|uniref:ATP-binding protein n=1 Tax=Streptomyces sp. ISL-11 TaxID=2819174 RepID=UPI001BE663C9|nr:ATP-binding protein [Streptomyces sp. ISL-11]MBT2382037.1 ATP-binding protein [Streptomyces sp. ISL-11]